ncbi:MAG: polysaccharide biosynthesis protein [Terriglobales bacterium]|jgi:FlaA1/EpsC-like NDP-sugar epimerase|nr:nucleoside-diphosphate sugar epimerase/dehydratase [Terriglobales bacterium]
MSATSVQLKRFTETPSAQSFIKYRKVLILASQIVLIVVSYYASFLLRLDAALTPVQRALFWETLPLILVVKLLAFYRFGLLHGWWRYVGMSDIANIGIASFVSSTVIFLLIELMFHFQGYPRSVIPIDMVLNIMLVGGTRFVVRAYTERAHKYEWQKKTLVVGAGNAGASVVRELKLNSALEYCPVGFVDDEPYKLGLKINGVKVLGNTDALPALITRHAVECVLIAIPSAKGSDIERIVDKCRECKVSFKILPSISELFNRQASVTQARKLRIEDLLSRQVVRPDLDRIRTRIEDRVLLVTGAGGSIGSELVRQVATFNPRKLVLLERSENDLFKIARELSALAPDLDFAPVVGDVLDVKLLKDVFALHRPNSVFHAAAYKHVPMMERNCFQAITNNIFGTYNVALVAKQFNADNFVMISSDKAVNPTNMMGVTKRVAEMIILGLHQQSRTRFMAVRFGNVLGSNGSVLPIFEDQIRKGGPVTVTHRDITRYFMTTSEAVQLVLQASSMGKGGEIFVLDMGEPVKVVDLARRMIRLSGYEPERDIKIVFTGLRPGEKLFEELRLDAEGIKPTTHDKIWMLEGSKVEFEDVRKWLEHLSMLVEDRNVHGLISKLVSIVPEYSPSEELVSLAEVDRHDLALAYSWERKHLSAPAEGAA